MKLNTYLNFGGNCEAAFRFYEQHLGGKVVMLSTWEQQPQPHNFPPEWAKKVLHARILLGEALLMGSDVPGDRFQPMRSAYLSLSLTTAEVERVHALLSEGGEIFMPLQETFFAFRFSMLRDRFGVSWMLIHERPMPA